MCGRKLPSIGLRPTQPSPSPAQKFYKRPLRHWPVSVGLPSWAWAAASERQPSQRSPGSCPCRSDWPAAWPRPSAGPAGRSGVSSKGEGREEALSRGVGGGSRHTLTGKAAASSGLLAFMETTPVNTTSLGHLEKHGRQVSERKSLCRPTTVCVCPMKDEINALGIFQHGSWLWGFQLFRNSRKNP